MPWDLATNASISGEEEHFSPFVPEASAYPTTEELEQDELTATNLTNAVDENRRYAQLLRWSDQYDRIAQELLGFTSMTPDMATFTQAVAGWQSRNNLKPDGVIGPVTWGALQRALGIAGAAPPGAAATSPQRGQVIPGTKRGGIQLLAMAQEPWPEPGGWLVTRGPNANCTELQRQIVLRALRDDGIQETPVASNRGDRIDKYTLRSGSPLGSYWCGIWVGAVFADCGALVPEWYGATKNWVPFLERTPSIGSAVLYSSKNDPSNSEHIGIVAMLSPLRLSIEGNRGYAGSTTNNGQAVDLAPMRSTGIMGYFRPRRSDGTM